jgi:carbohydrate-selective porin OprB
MRLRGLIVGVTALGLSLGPGTTGASQLDGALDTLETGEHYLSISAVPLYQYAFDAGEETGNYTFDVIGKATLFARPSGSPWGNMDLVFWLNASDRFSGMLSAPELAANAGLLWDTNDIANDSSFTGPLVLGIDQWFWQDRMSVGFGKLFPGQAFLSSPYTADNSNSFTSKMISGNPVVSWWESLGISGLMGYFGEQWFVQAAFVDAKAEDDLDWSSFTDGKYVYLLEATWNRPNEVGMTSFGAVVYYIDALETRESESGLVGQFTHEWGEEARYGVFGRYSIRDGGESRDANNPGNEAALDHGGFVGIALNRPFGRADQQLAASFIYGHPAEYKSREGFNTQYGIEILWKWQPHDWVKLLPNVQFMRNRNDDIETIAGIRINVGFERHWARSSLLDF